MLGTSDQGTVVFDVLLYIFFDMPNTGQVIRLWQRFSYCGQESHMRVTHDRGRIVNERRSVNTLQTLQKPDKRFRIFANICFCTKRV